MLITLVKKEISSKTILFAMALSGAAALIYEVVATQTLMYFFNSSTYSIATVLSSFLLGLAIGSFLIYKYLLKIKNKQNLFAIFQILIAIYALLVFTNYNYILNTLPYFYNLLGNNFVLSLIVKFLIATLYLIFPTIMLGASFPLASSLIIKNVKRAGSDVGKLYSWDLFGAIGGALISGFILMPVIGLANTFIFGAMLNLVAGLLLLKKNKKIIIAIIALLFILGSFVIISMDNEGVVIIDNLNSNTATTKWFEAKNVLFTKNSPYGEIRVVNDSDAGLILYINRRWQCSQEYSLSERQISSLVLNNFENKINVLNIGLGCGITLNQILKYDNVGNVDVVEINPSVIEASSYFSEAVESLNDERTKLIEGDGARFLTMTNKKYDAIIIDIENPALIHSSPLYTVEYFEIINSRLTDDGIFGLWAFDGNYEYIKIIYKTLSSVFDNVYLLKESADNLLTISSNKVLDYNLTYEEKERMVRLEKDDDYQINTLDKNILGDIMEKSDYFIIGEEDKTWKDINN